MRGSANPAISVDPTEDIHEVVHVTGVAPKDTYAAHASYTSHISGLRTDASVSVASGTSGSISIQRKTSSVGTAGVTATTAPRTTMSSVPTIVGGNGLASASEKSIGDHLLSESEAS